MASPVYSMRFIVDPGLSGLGTLVTVPAGYVYVVKQVTVYGDAALTDINGFFEDAGSGAALFDGLIPSGSNGWAGFYGQLVFNAGDSFQFNVVTGLGQSADCGAFGYGLTSP